jgi:hypothetical protein
MRHASGVLPLVASLFLLAACQGRDASDAAPAADASAATSAATPAQAQSPAAAASPASSGHYTIAGTTVAFNHALRLPDEDGKLRLLLTPDALSAEEQATVLGESWVGLSLLSKRTAQYADRYPFVVLEVRTEGGVSAAQVKHFYVMASGIAVPNHTDNINRSGFDHGVELLELQGERVRLRAAGEEVINGESRGWAFDVTA